MYMSTFGACKSEKGSVEEALLHAPEPLSGNLLMAERMSERISVSQADVHRFEPHLGHNWFSCGVFLVKSRHFGLTLTQTIRPNWQSF